jgi:hypothetical protein
LPGVDVLFEEQVEVCGVADRVALAVYSIISKFNGCKVPEAQYFSSG